ncbi:MAG: ABC transporter ATP-binding protein [Chloroflexi bacterium]|nr:ABC transporter ATP-binding protein [Chloroflexota bacterium]
MKVLLRELLFLKKYWRRAILAYVCMVGASVFAMATPLVIKDAVDIGLARGDQGFLVIAGLLVLGLAVLRALGAYGQTYLGEYLSQGIAYDIRNAIYDRLQRLSYAYHDTQQTGQLMSRATADVEAVRMFTNMGTLRLFQTVLQLLVACYLLFAFNPRLTLIVFALLPIVAYRAIITNAQLRPVWTKIQDQIADLGIALQENLSGVRVVRAFARDDFESRKYAAKANDLFETSYGASRIQSFNSAFMSFIMAGITAIILWFGGREVIEGRLTLGELIAFNSYLIMLAWPVRMLGWMSNIIARAYSAGERIFEILDAESAVKEKLDAPDLPPVTGLVRFDEVSFGYDRISPVLRHITFAAQPGMVVALLGATGSGKSTIVNLLPRFYDVTGGRITIDGVDIRDVTLASLRRNIGIVHQDVFLFTATIRDNLAYGATDASDEEIVAAAKVARLHDFIMGLPEGYDTWVGERGITLSGGQRQRVAIARTLLMNPRILIFDDSTSSVDMETEYLIQQALAELMQGRTTFIIAQRLRTVKNADLILVLKDGQIAESGTHEALLQQGGLYREIYDLQLRDQEEASERVGSR